MLVEMNYIVLNAIFKFFRVIEFLIIARALLSWLPLGYDNPIIKIVHLLTEPILGPIRSLLQRSIFGRGNMMIDFSPIIAFLLLEALKYILVTFFI